MEQQLSLAADSANCTSSRLRARADKLRELSSNAKSWGSDIREAQDKLVRSVNKPLTVSTPVIQITPPNGKQFILSKHQPSRFFPLPNRLTPTPGYLCLPISFAKYRREFSPHVIFKCSFVVNNLANSLLSRLFFYASGGRIPFRILYLLIFAVFREFLFS